MLEDPPLLTICRDFCRPDKSALASLAGIASVYLVDAMQGRGALDYQIQVLPGTEPTSLLVGSAITCHCGPADNLALFAAVAVAQPGDIIVAATDAFTETCLTGDLLLRMASNRNVLGLVTDGLVRDCAGIRDVGLPVYCRGVTPNSPVRNGPGSVGMPICLGAVTIHPGDAVISDEDGIVIVPRDTIESVAATAREIRTAEAEVERKIRDGLEVPDFITTLLESNKVRYVDGPS
ncbi:MAG: hypothetical protein MK179_15500 [Pirellulaceae bacterium]|nr:hypothetical protein [Pirellulaceae bacterium]